MDLSIYCPYCLKHTSVDKLITSGLYVGPDSKNYTFPTSWYNSKTKQTWNMCKCNSCDGVLLLLNDGEKIYPTPQPSPTDIRIPKIIRTDIEEAKKCFSVSAHRCF